MQNPVLLPLGTFLSLQKVHGCLLLWVPPQKSPGQQMLGRTKLCSILRLFEPKSCNKLMLVDPTGHYGKTDQCQHRTAGSHEKNVSERLIHRVLELLEGVPHLLPVPRDVSRQISPSYPCFQFLKKTTCVTSVLNTAWDGGR